MNTRLERIKEHLAENKWAYISGSAIAVTAFGAGVLVSPKAVPIVDSFKVTLLSFSWKSPTTNITTNIIEARADRGHIVKILETDQKFGSINSAASSLGVGRRAVQQCLRGERDTVNGLHLVDLGENLGQAV